MEREFIKNRLNVQKLQNIISELILQQRAQTASPQNKLKPILTVVFSTKSDARCASPHYQWINSFCLLNESRIQNKYFTICGFRLWDKPLPWWNPQLCCNGQIERLAHAVLASAGIHPVMSSSSDSEHGVFWCKHLDFLLSGSRGLYFSECVQNTADCSQKEEEEALDVLSVGNELEAATGVSAKGRSLLLWNANNEG